MNREEATKIWPIIKAYSEGETIEYRSDKTIEDWKEAKVIPNLSFNSFEYRIQPESTYRLFKDAEECWAEMQKHQPFGWVKLKATGKYFILKAIGSFFAGVGLDSAPTSYGDLMEEYTFADGTPFGIKVEE